MLLASSGIASLAGAQQDTSLGQICGRVRGVGYRDSESGEREGRAGEGRRHSVWVPERGRGLRA